VREGARDGKRILVAGGDGTAHFAANALLGHDVPLGILPVGTGNDIAVSVGVPQDTERAVHVLAQNHERAFDLVSVGERVACCVVGVGMDTEALQRINGARVLPRGHVLYTLCALQTLFTYRARHVRITWEGGALETELEFAAVTNTKSYAGGMRVTPDAVIDDGRIDLCVIQRTSLVHMVANFSRVLSGKHKGMRGVVMAQSPWVRLECDEALPVTLDGELTELTTPLDARVLPGALRLLGAPVALPALVGAER
jgi:diacylglycerol kinase (ATP)